MQKIMAEKALAAEERENLFQFMALLRVRVPAIRDAIEFMRAELVKMTLRTLDKQGKLPPKPEGLEDLIEQTVVSIDPHQSIHAMPHMMKGFGELLRYVGFEIIVNKTGIPLLTNDNPVMVQNPAISEEQMQPYRVSRGGPIEIIFPLSPKHILYGHSTFTRLHQRQLLWYTNCHNGSFIKRVNRLVAKYGYEFVFAASDLHKKLIEQSSALSPVPEFTNIPKEGTGEFLFSSWKFGTRLIKPK